MKWGIQSLTAVMKVKYQEEICRKIVLGQWEAGAKALSGGEFGVLRNHWGRAKGVRDRVWQEDHVRQDIPF